MICNACGRSVRGRPSFSGKCRHCRMPEDKRLKSPAPGVAAPVAAPAARKGQILIPHVDPSLMPKPNRWAEKHLQVAIQYHGVLDGSKRIPDIRFGWRTITGTGANHRESALTAINGLLHSEHNEWIGRELFDRLSKYVAACPTKKTERGQHWTRVYYQVA